MIFIEIIFESFLFISSVIFELEFVFNIRFFNLQKVIVKFHLFFFKFSSVTNSVFLLFCFVHVCRSSSRQFFQFIIIHHVSYLDKPYGYGI